MARPGQVGRLLLGVDCGQNMSKAALLDLDGRELTVARVASTVISPHPRWAEQDMDQVWAQVAAVGVCGRNGVDRRRQGPR
jgi:sugar (pentulose or hexulose) kinase